MSVRPDGAPRLATIPPPAHDEAPDDLDAVVDAIAAFRREVLEGSEREIVSLALAIAERIARTELATDPALVAAWAEEGLASLTREDVVTVHVSAPIEADWPRQLDVDVVVDPQLEPGTCRIVGRYGSVDAGLSARIASLAAALGVDP